jgi:hydroxyethylthiazole kinase-like uncharacterized protein yjeF
MPALPAPLPALPRTAHKGDRGEVVVIGGSALMLGAPCFTAHAALRTGAGVVRLGLPPERLPAGLALVPSAMGIDLGGSWWREVGEQAVLAIGMGWSGRAGAAGEARLVARARGLGHRLLLDGGAFGHLAARPRPLRAGSAILTPHPGEWRRLAAAYGLRGDPVHPRRRLAAARALADASGACVVLKGHHTIVAEPAQGRGGRAARSWSAREGGPELAIPGSGDTLAGAIAALWARGLDAFAAACLGVAIHGRAGAAFARAHGEHGLLALELGDRLPAALVSLSRGRRR